MFPIPSIDRLRRSELKLRRHLRKDERDHEVPVLEDGPALCDSGVRRTNLGARLTTPSERLQGGLLAHPPLMTRRYGVAPRYYGANAPRDVNPRRGHIHRHGTQASPYAL